MGHYEESRDRMIKDAIAKHFGPPKLRPEEQVMQDAKDMTKNIFQNHINPILKAGGGFDRDALGAMITSLYIQGFEQFTKEELMFICVVLHTEIAMEIVDASPTGGSEPDLLSGV